jgi:macrolide transport system ATP-binding/permease protein
VIVELLRELKCEGRTVVMVTHNHDVAAAARRVVALRDGRITGDRRITGDGRITGDRRCIDT